MKMRQLHWLASFFLLLIFLGSKSMEYHAASHLDEDSVECELCDFALLLHATPFEPALETAPEILPVFAGPGQPQVTFSKAFISKELYFRYFSRPPPRLS